MPRSLQAQMTRSAISPRLAMRIFWNMAGFLRLPGGNREQGLTVLHRAFVFHQLGEDGAAYFGLYFVHKLHRFDDAENLAGLDRVTPLDKRRRVGRWSVVVGADD